MTAPAPPEPPGALEGAGVLSSYADLDTAVAAGDGYQIAFAAAGAALDTLGLVADPFGSLLSAGFGWLMEHVAFLSEPLDALAGDPREVKAQAQSWHQVALELSAVAVAQRGLAAPGPDAWSGEAADAYRRAAELRGERVAGIAGAIDAFAGMLITAAAAVGTLRALVRDAIASFLADVVKWLLAGSVLAALTGGASLAATIGWVVVDAVLLAEDIARRIARLLESVAAAGHAAGALAAGVLDAARWTGRVAGDLHAGAGPVDELLERTPVGGVVELGKQTTSTDLEDPEPGP